MNRREHHGRRIAIKTMIALLGVFGFLQQANADLPGGAGNLPPFVARPFVQAIVLPEDFAGIETRDLCRWRRAWAQT